MIKERLVKFLSYKNIGQSVFEKKVGIANGYVNGIKKSIGSDILNKIAKVYPELKKFVFGHRKLRDRQRRHT